MRCVLFVITVFLWGIWFAVAKMAYTGEFIGSPAQNFIGWGGFSALIVAAILLIKDWYKKEEVENRIKRKIYK